MSCVWSRADTRDDSVTQTDRYWWLVKTAIQDSALQFLSADSDEEENEAKSTKRG